jgi:transposase
MIRLPQAIYVASAPINMHLSFDGLAGIVRSKLGSDPRGEALFVFHNSARTLLKFLWHDRKGYCVFYRRLDRGTYRLPLVVPPGASTIKVSLHELTLLLEGVDEQLLREARRARSADLLHKKSRCPLFEPCA